jgi:hypothetical protein
MPRRRIRTVFISSNHTRQPTSVGTFLGKPELLPARGMLARG